MGITQLFFFEATTLQEIQAFILETNLTSPPTNGNERLWGHPQYIPPTVVVDRLISRSRWVITWYEKSIIDIKDRVEEIVNETEEGRNTDIIENIV